MASRPSLYPYWATTTTNLTGTGNTNKVIPKTSLRDIGWDLGQQPTCEEFNWQLNNIDQWVEYLDSIVFAATASDTANTLSLRDSNGSFAVKQLTSTAPNGTKPFNVTSTTKVDNLNADLLDGFNTSESDTANTVVVRDSNGSFAVKQLTSTAPDGTKPFNVTSTTKVDNLNADLLDGMTTTSAATVSTVAARDINGNTSFNRVLLGDGSAVNPSLTFTSDGATNTGLYHSVDGVINVTVNSSDTGSFQSDGLHMALKGNADTASTVTSISGNITILTGVIADGGTIPLPSGYTEAQCSWFVSINYLGVKNDNTLDAMQCSAYNSRVVTCKMLGADTGTITGTANYIIIGTK